MSPSDAGGRQPEICICAAVKMDREVIRCHRHSDGLRTLDDRVRHLGLVEQQIVQGFITSRNRFVDRREAHALQIAAGIPSDAHGGYRGDLLFSEDLY